MEVFYKFKSAKDYDSIPIDWHYTAVSDIKEYLLRKKCSGKRNKAYYDKLTLTNADTNEDYLDGETLIPKNSFLIIRRAPWFPSLPPILVNPPIQLEESKSEDHVGANANNFDGFYLTESEWVELWNDFSSSTVLQDALPSKADEDRKIENAPALDSSQSHTSDVSFGAGRGSGHGGGMGGTSGGRRFAQGGLLDRIKPPPHYICHRCKVPGHFIQHCPTNGDPTFDIKPPTAIPSSTLEKSNQGSRSAAKLLTVELFCPLCRAVMKDAVLAKCCFNSFCDKCIRDCIMSKSLCFCGARNVLADDLLPNKTLRNTIIRILKSNESAPSPQPKVPCSSAPSKGGVLSPKSEGNTVPVELVEADNAACETLGEVTVREGVEVFKKRKLGNSLHSAANESSHHRSHSTTSNGYYEDQCKTTAAVSKNNYQYADDYFYESSDDNRHFKRRYSGYEASLGTAVVKGRQSSRGWREIGVTAANIGRLSVY